MLRIIKQNDAVNLIEFKKINIIVKLIGKWKNGNVPYISGGPLLDDYVFGQIHFHWGPNDTYGAEHTMHGFTFPLEMHMVHYKRPYGSIGNALKHVDGLAVVGILFTV